jgi:hypothetical protein
MAEAALDYDYFEPDETLEIPDGGIADFLTAKTGSWADDEVPSSGIAKVKHVAEQLAEYGRFDDEYMVHAAPNETVVPLPVLNANPRLKAALFTQMREMGLDPERYIVGNELNSINPVTGQREFGFFKKIKKFFKKVVKVVKKIAPIVLPIALAFTPLGPIYGAMLGSGLGSLAQGGSFKDALKAAAISGATAGIMKGIGGGIKGMRDPSSTFRAGATQALQEGFRPVATQRAAAALAATPTTAEMAPGTELGGFLDEAAQQAGFQELTAPPIDTAAGWQPTLEKPQLGNIPDIPAAPTPPSPLTAPEPIRDFKDAFVDIFKSGEGYEKGPLASLKESFFPRGTSAAQILKDAGLKKTDPNYAKWVNEAAKLATEDPGPWRRLLPIFGATMAAAKIAEGREEGEPEPLFDPDVTGETLLTEDPDKYMLNYRMPPTFEIQQWEGTGTGAQPTIQWAPTGADGGDVDSYPPRIGGINGPGTGTSDDVPAMLSDGEFVFTAKAVRGAGNGSRKAGTNNLYSLMRNFEGRA